MTPIVTTCAGCGREFTIPDRYQGRELKCPECGRPLHVEPPATPPAPAVPEADAGVPGNVFPEVPLVPTWPAESTGTPAPAAEGEPAAAVVYWRVRRLGVLSTAAASAVVYGLFGVVLGLAVAAVSLAGKRLAVPFLGGPLAAVLALVVAPLVYVVIGFVLGAVLAAAYNLAARLTGGVKVLLE